MENNIAVEQRKALAPSTLPSEAKPKPTTIKQATKQPAKKTKKAKAAKSTKTAKSSKGKKVSTALTKTLKLSETMQQRLDKFRKHLKRGVATRTELKAANLKLFRKKWSPAYITKNKAFKTSVPGLYSLVAQKGAAATTAAVKAYLAAQEAAKDKPAAAKKSVKSKQSVKASEALKKAG
jgi:thioredoxin reductase